jgi:hypothetical protein
MQAKAASFLESGGTGDVCREFCSEKEQNSDSKPRYSPSFSEYAEDQGSAPLVISTAQIKEEAIEEINCKIGMVRETPVIMVVELVNSQPESCMHTMVAIPSMSSDTEAEAFWNLFTSKSCVFDLLARAMFDVHVFSSGWSVVRVDDEPPDPGRGRGGGGRDGGPWGHGRGHGYSDLCEDGDMEDADNRFNSLMEIDGYQLHNPFVKQILADEMAKVATVSTEQTGTDDWTMNICVLAMVGHSEGDKDKDAVDTTQKNLFKKKLRTQGDVPNSDNTNDISAEPFEGDRREQ